MVILVYYLASITPVTMQNALKTTNFHFITVAMATKICFLIIFLLIKLDLVSTVILVYYITLFIAWVPYRGPKTTKMAKNIRFLVAMVTQKKFWSTMLTKTPSG